jgi:subtilisin family serine protease
MTGAGWVDPEEAGSLLARGTGQGVRIAIVDSGIEWSHPRLGGTSAADDLAIVSDGTTLITQAGRQLDVFGHGTAVAGIIHGVAPAAIMGSFRVLDGDCESKSAIICEAVRQALARGYHIINCSFGCGVRDQVLQYKAWVDEAYLKGVSIVSACNNDDFTRPEWPAHFPSVIAVNMAHTDDPTAFWYRHGNLVEFAARGVDVEVAWNQGRTKRVTGSSFAAPVVTGLLARLLSERPELTPLEAKALFHRTARPWTGNVKAPNVVDAA